MENKTIDRVAKLLIGLRRHDSLKKRVSKYATKIVDSKFYGTISVGGQYTEDFINRKNGKNT